MRTVDVTPTWEGLIPVFVILIENGAADGRKTAIEELTRLAKAMDHVIADSKKPDTVKDNAERVLKALQGIIDAYGGNIPDWLEAEVEEAQNAIDASLGGPG